MECVRPTKSAIISTVTVETGSSDPDRPCRNSGDGFRSSKHKGPSSLLLKRRQLQPLGGYLNPYRSTSDFGTNFFSPNSSSKTNLNKITQKVMSAKVLKVKQLQNELTEMQFQLNELVTENRILKTMQKKQELALRKYEGKNAELPRLIHSHDEEVRILKAKVKHLKMGMFEKDRRLKDQDGKILRLTELTEHLQKLSKDRNLGEREQLANKVEELQEVIQEQDNTIQVLKRKVMLETKTSRHHLAQGQSQYRKLQADLKEAVNTNTRLEALVQTKDRYINNSLPKRTNPRNDTGFMSLASNSKQNNKLHVEVYPHGRVPLDEENEDDLEDLSGATYTESNSPLSTNSLESTELAPQPGPTGLRRFTMSHPVREALYHQGGVVAPPGESPPNQADSPVSSPERNESLPSLGLDLQAENPNRPKAFSMFTLISEFKKEASSRRSSYGAADLLTREEERERAAVVGDSPVQEHLVTSSPRTPIDDVQDTAPSPESAFWDRNEPDTGVQNETQQTSVDSTREENGPLLTETPRADARVETDPPEVISESKSPELTTTVGKSGIGKRQHSGISKVEINMKVAGALQPSDLASNVKTDSPRDPTELPNTLGPAEVISEEQLPGSSKPEAGSVEAADQPQLAEKTPASLASQPRATEVEGPSKAQRPEPNMDPLRKTRLLRALRAIDEGDIKAMTEQSKPLKPGKNRQLFAEMRDKRREADSIPAAGSGHPLNKNRLMTELFEKEFT